MIMINPLLIYKFILIIILIPHFNYVLIFSTKFIFIIFRIHYFFRNFPITIIILYKSKIKALILYIYCQYLL